MAQENKSKVARLVTEHDGTGTPPSEFALMREEVAALRRHMERRDDLLQMFLQRMPSQDSKTISQLATAEAERDAAHARFRELRQLMTAMIAKTGEAMRMPITQSHLDALQDEIVALRETIRRERRDTEQALMEQEKRFERTVDRKLQDERLYYSDSPTLAMRFEASERDVAFLRDSYAQDRSQYAELRFDTSRLMARLDESEARQTKTSTQLKNLAINVRKTEQDTSRAIALTARLAERNIRSHTEEAEARLRQDISAVVERIAALEEAAKAPPKPVEPSPELLAAVEKVCQRLTQNATRESERKVSEILATWRDRHVTAIAQLESSGRTNVRDLVTAIRQVDELATKRTQAAAETSEKNIEGLIEQMDDLRARVLEFLMSQGHTT